MYKCIEPLIARMFRECSGRAKLMGERLGRQLAVKGRDAIAPLDMFRRDSRK